jgi:hypothetical protein
MRVRDVSRFAVTVALLALATGAFPAAGADPWLTRMPKLATLSLKAPGGLFTIDYPKDWMVVAGGGTVVATLASKNRDAAVVIDRSRLNQALASEDITDVFAQIESDLIHEREPDSTGLQSKVIDAGPQRLVVIQYVHAGLGGRDEVRQYSIPRGRDLFRLICSAPQARFAAYDQIFAHMAATFTPGATGTP